MVRVGPVGFLESRTWTGASEQEQAETSTQAPPFGPLWLDFCQS
jgi:hypothetical protein